jgi:hypothetical protein
MAAGHDLVTETVLVDLGPVQLEVVEVELHLIKDVPSLDGDAVGQAQGAEIGDEGGAAGGLDRDDYQRRIHLKVQPCSGSLGVGVDHALAGPLQRQVGPAWPRRP